MWKAKLKIKGITHEELAEKLEITRATMYQRFNDGKWKTSQKKTLKRLGILAIVFILFASCKKSELKPEGCAQCYQVITDSLTGDTIKISYGSSKKATQYCGEVLETVEAQKPVYFNNVVTYEKNYKMDTSFCQKVQMVCNKIN